MTQQEEIREIIDKHVDDGCHYPDRSCNALGSGYCSSGDEQYKCLMEKLTQIGVVIKAEEQTIQVTLPADGKPTGLKVPFHLSTLGDNIVAVKPLIKE